MLPRSSTAWTTGLGMVNTPALSALGVNERESRDQGQLGHMKHSLKATTEQMTV